MTQGLLLLENVLQFVGAFVAFSIALVSYKGVRQTSSSSLLRLAAAFVFLGTGFLLEGLYGFSSLNLIPTFTVSLTTLLIAGLFLETAGYFFLAFSHMLDVMFDKRMGVMLALFPLMAINQTSLVVILTSLSFYFILYGVVETLFAYSKNRNPNTLLIASGLAVIAGGWWISLVSPDGLMLNIVQLLMKEVGLVTLFIPVLRFMFDKKGKWNGPV
ncbi:MAG: hypothetical protein OK474_11510 [Thaumarchaeota archaeon]|nr:hypothetical protein [Nitrososphaerota archaeon]